VGEPKERTLTLADKQVAEEVVKRIEEIRAHGGNGSVEVHVQNGQPKLVKTNRCEVLQITK